MLQRVPSQAQFQAPLAGGRQAAEAERPDLRRLLFPRDARRQELGHRARRAGGLLEQQQPGPRGATGEFTWTESSFDLKKHGERGSYQKTR